METYKTSNIDQYSNSDNYGIDKACKRFLELVSNDEYFINSATFPLSKQEYAVAMDNLIVNNDDETIIDNVTYSGKQCYIKIHAAYLNLIKEAYKDIETNYIPYKTSYSDFISYREKIMQYTIVQALIIYMIIIFIYFAIVPFIFKDGRTFSMFLLKESRIDQSGEKIRWYSILLNFLVSLINLIGVVCVYFVLTYGMNSMMILTYPLFLSISLIIIYGISLAVLLASGIILLCDKNKKRTLSNLISCTLDKEDW